MFALLGIDVVTLPPDSDKLSGGKRILGPLSDRQNWTKFRQVTTNEYREYEE